MRFTVLGSGSCELDLARSSPAHLVRAGEASFLLDAGQGALRRLMQAGQDPADLTGVLISHHHLDHLADLLPLVFGLGYDRELKARANLTLVGHPGLGETWRGLEGVFGHWLRPAAGNLALRLLMPGEELVLGGVRIQTPPAATCPPAWLSAWSTRAAPWPTWATARPPTSWPSWPGGWTCWWSTARPPTRRPSRATWRPPRRAAGPPGRGAAAPALPFLPRPGPPKLGGRGLPRVPRRGSSPRDLMTIRLG